MANQTSHRLPPAPPPAAVEEVWRHVSRQAARAAFDYVSDTCQTPDRGWDEHVFSPRDPLTSLVMRADGVTADDLRAILQRVAIARGFNSFR